MKVRKPERLLEKMIRYKAYPSTGKSRTNVRRLRRKGYNVADDYLIEQDLLDLGDGIGNIPLRRHHLRLLAHTAS